MSSNTSIQIKCIFGLKPDTEGGVIHVEEHKILYTAGHNVVLYNTEDKTMYFFSGQEGTLGITSVALSPLKRYLAVAERAERALVTVYDVHTQRKKKQFNTTDCNSTEYVSMSFAPGQENKYLITMGGAPDWTLVYWQWDRPRVVSLLKIPTSNPITHISFNSKDHSLGFVATGPGIFRFFKLQDNIIKPNNTSIHKKESQMSSNYLCHAWLNDGKLVVGTDSGELLLLDEQCEYKSSISTGIEAWSAYCIIPYSKGFLVGGDESRILIFENNPEDLRRPYVRSQKSLSVDKHPISKILSLSLSPSEETLVCTLDNAQLYSVLFSSEREEVAEPLMYNFHNGRVTGLDVCIRKPLIVTCGLDKYVRIWNYVDKKMEVEASFNEEPYSVAFHPSGFHVIVGFADKLRLMNVFRDVLKPFKDLQIKACKEVRFSHGGHMFAVANGSNIQIFHFYTLDSPPHMGFNSKHGKVRALVWSEDDTVLVSAGWDGAVEWKLFEKNPEKMHGQEINIKAINFSSVLVTPDVRETEGRAIYTVSSNKQLKEIVDSEARRSLDTGLLISQLCLSPSGKILFAGIGEPERPGAVRCYKFSPLTGDYSEYQAHSAPIERMRVSADDCYLFTVAEDGCVIIYEIKDKEIRSMKREREIATLTYAEEILITKPDIEELNQQMENLKQQLQDLDTNQKMQYDLQIQEKDDLILKLKEQMANEAEQDKNRYETLQEAKKESEQQSDEKLKALREQFETEKQELESDKNQHVMTEMGRYQELSKERDAEAKRFNEEKERLISEHNRILKETEDHYKRLLEEERLENERISRERQDQERRFGVIQEQLDMENQNQLKELEEQHIRQMQQLKDQETKTKGESSLLKKKYQQQQVTIDEREEAIKKLKEQISSQEDTIQTLKKNKETQKKEMDERDKTILEKENRIYELKKKSQELEKFKFVLDYKIKELKREIGPREQEIIRLKDQTAEMDKELKHLNGVNENLGLIVDDLRMRQSGMQNTINKQSAKIGKLQTLIQTIKDGIYESVQYIQDYKKLKESILNVYQRYVRSDARPQEVDTDIHKEYEQQRKYLENNVSSLKAKLDKLAKAHKQDNYRIMKENVELISEINQLRSKTMKMRDLEVQLAVMIKRQKQNPDEARRELELIRDENARLRKRLTELGATPALPSREGSRTFRS
jgi:WD40 repeat protein